MGTIENPAPQANSKIVDPGRYTEFLDLDPALAGLVWNLPQLNHATWTREQRERWLVSFNAVCDMLFPESAAPATPEPAPSTLEIATLDDAIEVPDPMPYRGAKDAAQIVFDLIHKYGKTAHVYLNSEGRVKVAGEGYEVSENEQLIGVYTLDVKKSAIAADLRAASGLR